MNDCTKIRYASPAAAKAAVRQIATNYRKRGIPRVPRGIHPCAECHAWHVTSHRTNAKFRVPAA